MGRFASILSLPFMLACGGSTSTPSTTGPGTMDTTGSTSGPGATSTSGSTTVAGPGTTTVGGGGGAGGASGTGGAGGTGLDGSVCNFLRSPGTFTFHVHNTGSALIKLSFRCGGKMPIELDTPDGKRGTGPGNADPCERSCDQYVTDSVHCPGACFDCGTGEERAVMPGATTDVKWDRRVYIAGKIEKQCLAVASCNGGTCASGIPVPPTADQKGTLTICTDPNSVGVYCNATRTMDFTIDTTSGEGTIDAK